MKHVMHPGKKSLVRWLRGLVWLLLAVLLGLTILVLGSWVRVHWVENKLPQQAAPAQGRWIHAHDVDVYVQEFGNIAAPPLVLTHGTGAWSGTWRSNVEAMVRAGYRVIAVDLPPFGFSTRPTQRNYSRTEQAKRILALIDALGQGPVTLLGHSYGGGPAAEAAMLGPDRVRALILLDAAIGLKDITEANPKGDSWGSKLLDMRPLRTALLATVGTQPLLSEFWLKQFVARKEVVTPQRASIYMQPFVVQGFTESLGDWAYQFAFDDGLALSQRAENFTKLKMPVILIWGEEDSITPLGQAQVLHHLIGQSRLLVLPGVGHIPQIEDVELFNRQISDVLRQINLARQENPKY